jgi:hypothetical protein
MAMRDRSGQRFLLALVGCVTASIAALGEESPRQVFEAGVAAYQAENYGEAFEIWHALAERGLPGAQSNVGLLYSEGLGVEKDLELATTWFRHAARSDHAPAQYNLGLAYLTGSGTEKDDDRGLYWMRRSALQDYQPAQLRLAAMFRDGLGVPADPEKSAMWRERAETSPGPLLKAVVPPEPPGTPEKAESRQVRRVASQPPAKPTASQTTRQVQFAAFRSRSAAERARKDLSQQLAVTLSGVPLTIAAHETSPGVTYFRVLTSQLAEAEARDLRKKFVTQGVECLLR